MNERKLRTLKRYYNERQKLLYNEWKDDILIDGMYHCPVCDYTTDNINGLCCHLGNKDIIKIIYHEYFGDNTKCEICNENTTFLSLSKGHSRFCLSCSLKRNGKRLSSDKVKQLRESGLLKYNTDVIKRKNTNKIIGDKNKINMLRYVEIF